MVRYEIALILRAVTKQNLHSVFRQVCTTVLDQGNVIRKLENLGERRLPYAMRAHKEKFTEGRYAVLDIETPPTSLKLLNSKLKANNDIIRATILKHQD